MENQPQYFAVGEGVAEEGRPPLWRTPKFFAVIGLLFGVVLIGVFLVNVFMQGKQEERAMVESLEQRLAGCDNEKDPATCKERLRLDAARSSGSGAVCKGLTDVEFDSCIILAARQSGDVDICDALADEAYADCKDLVTVALAVDATHVSYCETIHDPDLAAACVTDITNEAIATGSCVEAGVDVAECDAAEALRVAIATGTAEACRALSTDEQVQMHCFNGIASVDNDDDGLVLEDEVAHGTSDAVDDTDGDGLADGDEVHVYQSDPKNADSDGDGYNDGEEVKNGYSPVS